MLYSAAHAQLQALQAIPKIATGMQQHLVIVKNDCLCSMNTKRGVSLPSTSLVLLYIHHEEDAHAGRVTVHPIHDSGKEESEGTFQVPFPGAPGNVKCLALSAHFLIVGTSASTLQYYQCHDKTLLNEFKHMGGAINKVIPQPCGTR